MASSTARFLAGTATRAVGRKVARLASPLAVRTRNHIMAVPVGVASYLTGAAIETGDAGARFGLISSAHAVCTAICRRHGMWR